MCRLVSWNTVNFVDFSVIYVSQGSVATYVRCGGISTQRCIANFVLSLLEKEFLKSIKIWQSYCPKFGGFLFWNTVYIPPKSVQVNFLWGKMPSERLLHSFIPPKQISGYILNVVTSPISCQNYFCRTAKFGGDILIHRRPITILTRPSMTE